MRAVQAAPGRERAAAAACTAAVAGLCATVVLRDPTRHTIFPPCPFHAATGGWCPGCGATRASAFLLRGDLAAALHHNALWVVLAPLAAWQLLAWAGRAFGLPVKPLPVPPVAARALLVAVAAFFVVRNLPVDALDLLNPPGAS